MKSTHFNNKKVKLITFCFVCLVGVLGYIYITYDKIKENSMKNLKKDLILKYKLYIKTAKKNQDLQSVLIENPYYINNTELVDEMKKSTPLLTKIDKYEDSRFDITFQYFSKDKTSSSELKDLQQRLEKEEYTVFLNSSKELQLFGKVPNRGYVLVSQNITRAQYILSELRFLVYIILGTCFFAITMFLYLLHLKKELEQSSLRLNQNYEQLFDDTKKLAFEDRLTGAATRLKFDETLKDLLHVASRFEEQTFTVMMMDIDHFKNVNDTYGHDYGDMVLKKVASVVLKYKKSSETFARWGGEEFIILSPLTKLENSVIFANKLREEISELKFDKLKQVTCSFGVSEYRLNDNEKKLVKRADELLYKAKLNGRNRVEY